VSGEKFSTNLIVYQGLKS